MFQNEILTAAVFLEEVPLMAFAEEEGSIVLFRQAETVSGFFAENKWLFVLLAIIVAGVIAVFFVPKEKSKKEIEALADSITIIDNSE